MKDKADDSAETPKYFHSPGTTLIPGLAPFVDKVFDQIEEITKEQDDKV